MRLGHLRGAGLWPAASLLRRSKSLGDLIPIHHVPESRYVIRAAILIVEIVGVLPYVQAQKRRAADAGGCLAHQRAVLVGRRTDREFAAIDDEPSPTAAK